METSLVIFVSFFLTTDSIHLKLLPGAQCTYNYDLQVHAHRGERSTKELNFKINMKVDVKVVERHEDRNDDDFYVTYLHLHQPRVIRMTHKRPIKHAVDHDLEEKLSKPFYFLQNTKGKVTDVFYPHEDSPDIVGLKKGVVSAVNVWLHHDGQTTSYETEEEDDSGIHVAFYNVSTANSTHVDLTKKWTSEDYLKHADGRPVNGKQHSKSHYHSAIKIEQNAIKAVERTHWSYLHNDKPYKRPLYHPAFQKQPDFAFKASGDNQLHLISCVEPAHDKRTKRSSENENVQSSLAALRRDTLTHGDLHRLNFANVGNPKKPNRTLYELLRCHSDRSVKESELSQCIKELHYLARTDDDIFQKIVNLIVQRSHQNFSTWSGLVGTVVVRGDYKTQQLLAMALLSDDPRPLTEEEHSVLLEAVYFIPSGPLYPELLHALVSLHRNNSKGEEVTVRAMLVVSGLTRRSHEAGYNTSLSDTIVQHLRTSFKRHPARYHDNDSETHETYLRNHLWAFGNLGHVAALGIITAHLEHDNSDIRYSAVSALRKLSPETTDHHLLRVLKNDEHVRVKAGVIEVFIERRQNMTSSLQDAIEDALWRGEEDDELDSAITELLENNGDNSHHAIKNLRKRRAAIRRQKRALFPALKPREFVLGQRKEWRKGFGGSMAGSEAVIRFANQVKLRIGIFGGKFEVDLDNVANIRAHVIFWSFDVLRGKAAFKMAAGFKNDIPKDLLHTITDAADDVLVQADALSSIFTKHVQNFINKLKNYLPLNGGPFLEFIANVNEFLKKTIQSTRFGRFFSQIVNNLRNALRANGLWQKIANLANKILKNVSSLKISYKPFEGAFRYFNRLVGLVLRIGSGLPRGFPISFNVKEFLKHISGPFSSITDAARDYWKSLGIKTPGNFFEMLHFKITLRFPLSLNRLREVMLRLLKFGNEFLELSGVFRDMIKINLPRLKFPELGSPSGREGFDFGLSFDWRIRLNFKIDFSGVNFARLRNLFRFFAEIFRELSTPNVDLTKFFRDYLPGLRIRFGSVDKNTTGLNVAQWFKESVQEFLNLLNQDKHLLDFSNTANFLDELAKESGKFSKTALKRVCRFQGLILDKAESLQNFGANLENETVIALKRIEDDTQAVIGEVINMTVFVDDLIDELKTNLSKTAKEFVDTFLVKLEDSLENVKDLADNIAEFADNSTEKLTGFCYKTANFSGDVLDNIQSEAAKAVGELASFVTSHSGGITDFINRFKQVVDKVEKWYEDNLENRLGKYANVGQTLEEFLSLLKNVNNFWNDVHKVSANINDVVQHLQDLPEHARRARQVADKVVDFATNAKRWEQEVKKLDIRRKFKLDFDEQLRKLCNEFKTLAKDSVQKIQGDELFKTFREFVTKKTDALISGAVEKLELLKEPVERVRGQLKKVSESVSEVGAVLSELRPFSENFSPILQAVSQLPDCSDLEDVFGNIIKKCWNGSKIFSKQAYRDYLDLKSEVGTFLELIPEEWESLKSKCLGGGTCQSEAFTKQGKGVSEKIKTLRKKFESEQLFESLEPCKEAVEAVSHVVNQIKNISKMVEKFTLKDEIKKIEELAARITGKFSDNVANKKKRSVENLVKKVKNLVEHIKAVMETKEKVESLVEEVFGTLQSIHNENVEPFQGNLENVQENLALSYEITKKSGLINPGLQAVDTTVGAMADFIDVVRNVVEPLQGTVLDLFTKVSEFTDIFDDRLQTYGDKVKKVSDEVNGFLDKIITFLQTVQLRQRGLDIRKYKPWNQYDYCSQNVCLRPLRRSSKLYLSTAFPWKFPHLDDLSSFKGTGKWLVPGLFDDYKVRSIAELSSNEMLLGMQGVASSTGNPSLLVVIDTSSGNGRVRKICQVKQNGSPFRGDMGGVVILKPSYIWMSSGDNVHAVSLSDLRNSMSSTAPSDINIKKTKTFSHQADSISYDDKENKIWIVDTHQFKAFSYQVSPFGDILSQKDNLETGQYTRGLAIVQQFGVKYACVAKCALVAGFQCKLEFHGLDSGILDDSTLHRVVRTPTGLESIQTAGSESLVAAFSSGTFSEKDKIERIAGDFEDRFFKLRLPIFSTNFSIYENCVYLKVRFDWIIPAKRLFPIGEKVCGSRRKRYALEEAMDSDVYSEDLEQHRRVRRGVSSESVPCSWNFEGEPKQGSYPFIPESGFTILVFGIPVRIFFGADGHYYANYRISLCLPDKTVKLSLIPGAWVTVYAGASLVIFIVEAGVTVEAKLLETYLVPELSVRVDKWPLEACVELRMDLTPLSIRVYLWYRFRLCISISTCGWFCISISIDWCRKHTFAEWSWSMRAIHMKLFTTCKKGLDRTPPEVGQCTAKQVGNKKYYVQWSGFTEDTKIQHYTVTIGSIRKSGDDHYSILGVRQSLLVSDLEITHGRSVYVGVAATNGAGLKSPIAECPVFTARRRSPVVTFINDGETSEDIDYQSDNTRLAMNYGIQEDFSEISTIEWGVSSSSKCTLTADECDVLSLRTIGENYFVKKTALELKNGGKYYTRVKLVNLLGMATVACSDGVIIDTTPPLPRGFTVGNKGSKFIPTLKRVRGKYEGFIDSESPMVKYEWKLTDEERGRDVVPYTNIPLSQRSPLLDGLSLTAGKKYTAVLRGFNAAGLYNTVNVSGIVPDDTVPVCDGDVADVTSFEDDVDEDFVRQLDNLTARFDCYDPDSGIQSVEAAVGTYPGGANILPFNNAHDLLTHTLEGSTVTWVVFPDVNVTSLIRYYVTIKVRNNAGLAKTVSSDGIMVDTTGPTVLPSYIRDGDSGIDAKFSNSSNTFVAHWENAFADAESGIGEYFVGLGTSPGSDDQSGFKSYGVNTRTVISGGALQSGRTYYVTVIGCNRVRMCVNASSNGAMVDFIPPHSGLVKSGIQGPSVKVTWIDKAVWARWQWCPADKNNAPVTSCSSTSFYDKHSGIKHFGLSVLSHDTAELLAPVKTVGRVVTSGRNVVMPNGVFSVLVEAEDRAGVRSNVISKSFIVDTTPPQVVQLFHGNEHEPIKFTRNPNHVFTAFLEMSEDVSEILTYSVGVGSYAGGDDVIIMMTYTPLVPSSQLHVNWSASTETMLLNERRYYITVKGINSAGIFQVTSSEPLIFDDQKPTVGYVFDGWSNEDAKYHSFASIYRMHWRGIKDNSGIKETYVCLSSTRHENNCDLHSNTKISNTASSHSFINLKLQSGVHCYALLQLVDNAGNHGNYWSTGALVDTSPPTAGRVIDGELVDHEYQRETNILHAKWSGFIEIHTSIHHYELAFGTRPNITDIQPFTDIGLVTSAASSNLLTSELQNGVVYYAQVIAYNPVGLPSEVASSNGVIVDSTPPTFPSPVFDGAVLGVDLDYSYDDSSLSVNWKCEDKQSGLVTILVGFGTQPGIQDVASFQSVLPYQTSYSVKNVTLLQGYRYYATVKCTNRVGLHSSLSSNGVTFDSSPPSLSFVHDGLNIHNDLPFVGLTSSVSANWKFVDSESYIKAYYISIKHQVNGSIILGPKLLPGTQTSMKLASQGKLNHGGRYYFSITAMNGAGLNATGKSNGFIADSTAPVCSVVYTTTLDGTRSAFSGQNTKLAVHFECEDEETEIATYQLAIKDTKTAALVLPFHKIKTVSNLSSFAVVDGAGRRLIRLENGGSYQVGVRATNKVNLSASYWTQDIIIDLTPPVFKKVLAKFDIRSETINVEWDLIDNDSGIQFVFWSLHSSPDVENPGNFTEISKNVNQLQISEISFQLGQTYFVYLRARNKAGLSTLFVSDGVIVDRTPPSSARLSADFVVPLNYDGNPNVTDGASFTVKWSGFMDQESGIRSYKWAVGLSKESTESMSDEYYTEIQFIGSLNGYVIKNQTIYNNNTYYICIRATNGAGLSTNSCSQGIMVKLGKLTAGVAYDGLLSNDIDFQLDDKAVRLHWEGFEDPVYGLKKYEWCYGFFESGNADQMNCTTSFSAVHPPLKTSAHRFHNVSLDHGQRYSVKVQASNFRDETVTANSDGFIVDRTAPSAGVIKLGGSQGTRTMFLAGMSAPTVSWTMIEKESVLEEFQLSVGSLPLSNDLFPIHKLDGKLRSVNLDDMNFTVAHGMSCFVTLVGKNVLGLETSMTSPQVVVDWTPPIAGEVRDGNWSTQVDFQVEDDYLAASWSEFLDPESDVVEYWYCIGTKPDFCDVQNATSANLDLKFNVKLKLDHGVTYYTTITAINGAGLSISSSSTGVTIDHTHPIIRGFSLDSIILRNSSNGNVIATAISADLFSIPMTWDTVDDEESDVKSLSVCVGTNKDNCDLKTWTDVDPESSSAIIHFLKPLQPGAIFVVCLKATNGAGLETIAYSNTVMVDTTPPVKGRVQVAYSSDLVFLQDGQPLRLAWQGFEDPESGIKHYEWKICLTSKTSHCTSTFVGAGSKKSLVINDAGLDHGKEYQCVVKAVNYIGLETEAISSSFILDKTPPETGMVFDGVSTDQLYQSSSSEISANWKGFQDKESSISFYEICIGLREGLCDVYGYTNIGLKTHLVVSNLNLTHNTAYYTSIRATNGAGQTTFTSSNGIIVDVTSPIGGELRDGDDSDIDVTMHDSFVSVNWDEFGDEESGILKYVVCAGSTKGACDILPPNVVTSGMSFQVQVWPHVASGTTVYSTLKVYNKAGGLTEGFSDGVLVDTTPPDVGKVTITSEAVGNRMYLTSKNDLCASWSGFADAETTITQCYFSLCLASDGTCPISSRNLNNRTSLCLDDPPVTEGDEYYITIEATNQVGLSSMAESSHFIIDSTEPDSGDVVALNPLGRKFHFVSSELLAKWHGFFDPQSGIKNYVVCLGTEPGLCDTVEQVSVDNSSQYTWSGLNLTHNAEYFVSVRAENNAGLFTNFSSSDPISVDKTAPDPSLVLDGPEYSKDIDYQQSWMHVAATWFAVEDPESDVIELTWCVGSKPKSCDLKSKTPLQTNETKVSAHVSPLVVGTKYFITLVAVNGAGGTTTMVSDGVTIDYTPPLAGVVIDGDNQNTDYVSDGETIYAHWSGFNDPESGIKSYQFALCEKQNTTSCPSPFADIGQETNVSLSDINLVNNKEYVIIVRAINMVGLTVQAMSNGLIMDSTAPLPGHIWIVKPKHGINHHEISARWEDFLDLESKIAAYEVCLGLTQGDCEVKKFEKVGMNNTYNFSDVTLVHKQSYYVTVKAVNNIGLSTLATTDEIYIDLTPPIVILRGNGVSSAVEGVCNAGIEKGCENEKKIRDEQLEILCFGDLITAMWSEHEDDESGIEKVEWCVESVNDTCDIRDWRNIDVTLLTISAIVNSLPTLTSVRVQLRITNGVGNSVVLKSLPCHPQKLFPPEIQVNEVDHLNDTDIDYQTNTDTILVTWSPPVNATGYPRVQAALTRLSRNSTDSLRRQWRGQPFVSDFVDIPSTRTRITFTGDKIEPYTQYRAVVRVWNEFGFYRDSVSNGVTIAPDAPPLLQVKTADTFLGSEDKRWENYFKIPTLTRNEIENTYFFPDPFSVKIDISLSPDQTPTDHNNEITPVTYKASVYRVTPSENETINETVGHRVIFEHSHILDENHVCCRKKNNNLPRTVFADKQFKPVKNTDMFGISVGGFENGMVAASSSDAVYIFSEEYTRNGTIMFKHSSGNNNAVKLKTRDNKLLVSGGGNVIMHDVNLVDKIASKPLIILTNCNHTMIDKVEYCVGEHAWSSSENVGNVFAYDGSDVIVVSGSDPVNGDSVLAIFQATTLVQVLSIEKNDSILAMAVNTKFLVILHGDDPKLAVYSKGLDDLWEKETKLSEEASNLLDPTSLHLTDDNMLFVISVRKRYLVVAELTTTEAVSKCIYTFPTSISLSGGLDVKDKPQTVAAVGMMINGRDGVELVMYEPGFGCSSVGRVVAKTGLRFDDGQHGAAVALLDDYVIIGSPGANTWPTDYVEAGTGRVYLTTYCPRNFKRKKVFKSGQQREVLCMACEAGEQAYPGFEKRCMNCSRSICLPNSMDLQFQISHCDQYPCNFQKNRNITKHILGDNLTVIELGPSLENDTFYKTDSEQNYFIRISQLSAAGVETVSDSAPFSLDYTSPEPGYIYDGLGSDGSKNCSANTTFSSEHQCSSRSFSNTDLDFTNNTAEITARWIDFRDNESDIESYFWCIGSRPLRDDIMECENATGHPNRTLSGLSLQHNDTYYVTVVACNYAGLCTAKSTDGVLVDTTPPVMHYVRDGLMGPDINFQVFTNIIFGNWFAEDPESGVVSFEVGWGSAPGLDDVVEFQEVGNATAYYAEFTEGELVKGNSYYVTVRAINGAGLESELVSSNGIVVGKTEFVFSKNDSGSFFFDTVDVDKNETKKNESVLGNTFGTLDVPAGAVDEEVKFQCYSLSSKEMEHGTDDKTTVVDPEVVKPPKHFKLGNYSFQIKAYDTVNNSLHSKYQFKKPVTISLFYDVEQMLEKNKKVVSNEVTKDDIDPVLLLWDVEKKIWYDAAKTCPEPYTFVDRDANLLKVKVCHLTQFALFWSFAADNGIIEFKKGTTGPPHAAYEDDDTVIYSNERYGNRILFDVIRRKGSTGNIQVSWGVTIEPPLSLTVSPMTAEFNMTEGQWNTSFDLQFLTFPQQAATLHVKLTKVSGGAKLGNFTTVQILVPDQIVFPSPITSSTTKESNYLIIILPAVGAGILLIVVFLVVSCVVNCRRRRKRSKVIARRRAHRVKYNPIYGYPFKDGRIHPPGEEEADVPSFAGYRKEEHEEPPY